MDRDRRRAHPLSSAIGVFGGTFAPIHNGHLRLAIEAYEQLGLDEVRFVPAAAPPLRPAPPVPPERRRRWVELAIAGEAGLVLDARELGRAGPSYMVDTLAELRAEHRGASLCLLLGLDAAARLPQWHRWEALADLAHLIMFARPGAAAELAAPVARLLRERDAGDPARLREQPSGLCWQAPLPPLAVSASDVRRRLREGRSIRGLVPDRVIDDFTAADIAALAKDALP